MELSTLNKEYKNILSDTLNINGTSKIKNATWKVHFTNVSSGSTGSVSPIQAPVISSDELSVSYQVNLDKPGDFYEFTATVKNDGSVDAKLATSPLFNIVKIFSPFSINFLFYRKFPFKAICWNIFSLQRLRN